jgi:RNA polymerase sigma factor (sigma-70 family)
VALGIEIVRKKRADLWRKAARRGEATAEDATATPLPDQRPSPDRIAADRERLRLYATAAARLGERCREILRRKIEGRSFVEIAAELGRPVNTVYSWDWRCHRKLRELLGRDWAFVAGEEER